MKICSYLFPWLVKPECSQGMCVSVVDWDNGISRWMIWRRSVHDPLVMGKERKGRLHWVFCYRAEDETGGLDLERRER